MEPYRNHVGEKCLIRSRNENSDFIDPVLQDEKICCSDGTNGESPQEAQAERYGTTIHNDTRRTKREENRDH